jgi:hypothetical protein
MSMIKPQLKILTDAAVRDRFEPLRPNSAADSDCTRVTALTFSIFDLRYTRSLLFKPRALALRPRRPQESPAPALWLFALSLGVLLPILLG